MLDGREALRDGRFAEALDCARRAGARLPRSLDAHRLRYEAARALGRAHEQREALRLGFGAGEGAPWALQELGDLELAASRSDAARAAFARGLHVVTTGNRAQMKPLDALHFRRTFEARLAEIKRRHIPPTSQIARPLEIAPLVARAATPRAEPTPAPTLPAPARRPENDPPAVDVRVGDSAALLALAAAGAGDLPARRAALLGHRLAVAGRFDEILGLAGTSGLERLTYQLDAVRRVLGSLRGRALLADEVGLGKTIEACLVLREYVVRGMARRALVLAPPALVSQWREELAAKFGLACATTEDADYAREGPRFFERAGILVASLATAASARNRDAVRAQAFDLVLVDEAHHLKRRSTRAHALVDGLRSRFLLLITATPVERNLDELYALVTLLRPGHFRTPADFRRQFVDPDDPTSPRNRERLRALLGEVMIRNTRALAGVRLPPRRATTIVVDPPDAEASLYARAVEIVRAHKGALAPLALRQMLERAGSSPRALAGTCARLAAGDTLAPAAASDLRDLGARAAALADTRKIEHLLGLVTAGGEKKVVFTQFRDTLAYLAERLAARGVAFAVFSGGMTAQAKDAAVARFRDEVPVLLATEVGGEGRNLQFASTLVNFDVPWNPMRLEQRIGRLHRLGQTREVSVYNLAARGTAEERMLGVLERRINLFELVVGELDLVLGQLADERELGSRILDIYAHARDDAEVHEAFDRLGAELAEARLGYDRARALDEALFGRDYEA
ncbi:MAG: SNF2-related protein [Myxococcota bacterium]